MLNIYLYMYFLLFLEFTVSILFNKKIISKKYGLILLYGFD